jgi:hypothetical protein
VAESSWPNPATGRVIDDAGWEKMGILLGPYGGVVGDFTSPQLIYGDSSGRQIKVAADRYALVRGHTWWSGSSIVTVPIASNSSGSTRTDLVVLRMARTTWDVTLTVIAGTPGAGAPAPVQNGGTTGNWDLPLATVSVANGAATISAGNVTYVGPHLSPDGGGLRVATTAAAAYIPSPLTGMGASVTDGTELRYGGSAWASKFGWSDFSPVAYHHNLTTRIAIVGYVVNKARYLQIGKLVHAYADVTVTGASTGGVSLGLPVNAASRWNGFGAGGIFNSGGAPTQCGVVTMGPNTLDHVLWTSFTTAWADTAAGTNALRYGFTYEAA